MMSTSDSLNMPPEEITRAWETLLTVPPLVSKCISVLGDTFPITQRTAGSAPELFECETMYASENRHSGIAMFRLISKQASEVGIQFVTGYCVKLVPEGLVSLISEPLLKVAGLLQNSKLQRLQVEVEVCSNHHLSPRDSIHRTAQLEEFVSVLGTVLKHVTSLNFKVIGRGTNISDTHLPRVVSCTKRSDPRPINNGTLPPQLSDAEASNIAALLTNACPIIAHIGLGGDIGLQAIQVFGSFCPFITSLDLLDAWIPVEKLRSAVKNQLLPNVSTIRVFRDQWPCFNPWDDKLTSSVLALCTSATLTELDLSQCQLRETAAACRAFPPGLKTLHLWDLGHDFWFPNGMQLGNLRHLVFKSSSPRITHLACILRAAPLLQKITSRVSIWSDSSTYGRSNSLTITGLTPTEIGEMQMLRQRLDAGLMLDIAGLDVSPAYDVNEMPGYEDLPPDTQHVKDILKQLPSLPGFTRCKIVHGKTNEEAEHVHHHGHDHGQPLFGREVDASTESLSHIARVLPNVTQLCVIGLDFYEAEVRLLSVGRVLQQLTLFGMKRFSVSVTALVDLIINIPSLRQLLHDSTAISSKELQMMLQKARAEKGSGGTGQSQTAEESSHESVWRVRKAKHLVRDFKFSVWTEATGAGRYKIRDWYKQGFSFKKSDLWFGHCSTFERLPSKRNKKT